MGPRERGRAERRYQVREMWQKTTLVWLVSIYKMKQLFIGLFSQITKKPFSRVRSCKQLRFEMPVVRFLSPQYNGGKWNLICAKKYIFNNMSTTVLLWINHRPLCGQYSLELLSTKEIVVLKPVDSVSVFCGLSRLTGALLLERDAAVEIFLI